jgi:hypothetical protein
VFELFDVIFWFGNNAETSLSLAQKTSSPFFNDDGRMFMSVYVSGSFDEQSDFLDFTPIDSLVSPTDSTLILDNGAIIDAQISGWPELESTSILGVVKPMHIAIGATSLYEANLTARDNITLLSAPFTGISTIMAKKEGTGGETNFIISTIEINRLDGMLNIGELFNKILFDEFNL